MSYREEHLETDSHCQRLDTEPIREGWGHLLQSQAAQLIQLRANLHNRSETDKEVPAEGQLGDLGTDVPDKLLSATHSER